MENSISTCNYDLISDCENDSGVFSETTTSTQFPIYFARPSRSYDTSRNNADFGRKKSLSRIIRKTGKANIFRKIPNLWAAYIRDIGNTLVNSRWSWTLICFASSYLLTWLMFAVCYMLIALDNNDVSEDHPSKTPCLMGIQGFAGYFLFSLETQHTIGYGSRYITSNCAEGTFLISLQMIMGISLCGVMTSVVYTKMVRPHNLPTAKLFSKTCVVCQRDGELCLIFRVKDKKNQHQVNTKINMYLVHRRNEEPYLKSLKLEPIGLLLWPLEIVHKITPASPFWDLSAKDLIMKRFELLATLQGSSLTTAQSSMMRASYLSKEILWGHRFKPCVKYDYKRKGYYIDSANFNETEEVLTPLCSAQRLNEVSEEISSTVSSPYLLRSPTFSRNECDSSRSSSGIASSGDEFAYPAVCNDNVSSPILRKLSTIRELNSTENLVNDLVSKQGSFVTLENTTLGIENNENSEDSENETEVCSSGIFTVRDLMTRMPNYSDSDNLIMMQCKSFSETSI